MTQPAEPKRTGLVRQIITDALVLALLVAIVLELMFQRYNNERMTHRIDLLQQHVEHLTQQLARPQGAQ